MVHKFWLGFAGSAYVGYGETYVHPKDILWWSKGGVLHGESSKRIAFLRTIIEGFPTEGLKQFKRGETDSFIPDLGPRIGNGVYPEYGLFYFGVHQLSFILLNCPEEGTYHIDVIDT